MQESESEEVKSLDDEPTVPCAVCRRNPAVFDMELHVYLPCWKCQMSGWVLEKQSWRSWLWN